MVMIRPQTFFLDILDTRRFLYLPLPFRGGRSLYMALGAAAQRDLSRLVIRPPRVPCLDNEHL